jgi:hypothetical protein
MRATLTLASAFMLASLAIGAEPALAGCKRFGFTVNDYGKEGPIRDAKALLDKHVASWAKENGVSDYRVGPKKVSCDLFLDFIVFDEHTCTASANVCWGEQIGQIASTGDEDGPPPAPVSKAVAEDDEAKPQKAAAAQDQDGDATADAPINLINGDDDGPANDDVAAKKDVDPTMELPDMEARAKKAPVRTISPAQPLTPPSQTADAEDEKPSTIVETGALSRVPSEPTGRPAPTAPAEEETAVIPDQERAAAASAAAAAAAAAERAAAAAETAANAAKEAAAAAVEASAVASRKKAVVPPLDSARAGSSGTR